MHYIEAPEQLPTIHRDRDRFLFLAGGITNCPDWQTEMVNRLTCEEDDLFVLNPRRKNFPINDPKAALEQIKWEYEALMRAHAIVFWFSRGSLNPIVLFEYGKELGRNESMRRPLLVGCDPEYPRKQDVQIQTDLAFPDDMPIRESLEPLISDVRLWLSDYRHYRRISKKW